MALQGAVKNTFNIGFPRFFAGSLSQLAESIIPAALASGEWGWFVGLDIMSPKNNV
jgi:hypothetical protein